MIVFLLSRIALYKYVMLCYLYILSWDQSGLCQFGRNANLSMIH